LGALGAPEGDNGRLTDDSLQQLFFIGSYRSNEVIDDDHPLNEIVMSTLQAKQVPTEHMKLNEMSLQATGEFIADSLCLPSLEVAESLTQAVFCKTLGNPLYTKQALEHLVRKNVLFYDTISFSWSWNFQSKNQSDNHNHNNSINNNTDHGQDNNNNNNSSKEAQVLEDLLGDGIVEMVKSKIETLTNAKLQRALAVASYIRATFDVDTLLHVLLFMDTENKYSQQVHHHHTDDDDDTDGEEDEEYEKERDDLIALLDQAVEEGLLLPQARVSCTGASSRNGMRPSHNNNREYRFSHDRVQEASTTLIGHDNDDEMYSFLRKLGYALLHRAQFLDQEESQDNSDNQYNENEEDGMADNSQRAAAVAGSSNNSNTDWMYFAAARHLNSLPPSFLKEKSAKIELAQLNLHAAELSMGLLAFTKAMRYVKCGIANIGDEEDDKESMWTNQFDLAFELHSAGAQALVGSGNFDEAEVYCNKVLARKTNLYHAMPAYKAYLEVMGGRGKIKETLQMVLSILKELGVKFPKSATGRKLKAWITLQEVKARHIPTEDSVRNMPYATDLVVVDTMEILQKAVRFAFADDIDLYVLLCCESMRWICKHGLTDTSGASVASFANVITHRFGDFETGTRLAELAIMIVDRQKNKFNETQALNTANMNVLGWVRPIKTRLPYHIRAYKSGMLSGNTEGACVSKWFSYWVLYHSASPLAVLEEDMRLTIPKVKKMGLPFFATVMSMLWQLALNLMGDSDNTTLLVGKGINEKEEKFQKMPFSMILATFRSYGLAVFGDFEAGAEDALERGNSYIHKMIGMQYGLEPFYRGISLYAMARKTGLKKYKTAAIEVRQQYKTWVHKGCVNLVGLLKLLDAEHAALSGKKAKARKKFEDAIATLIEGAFYNNAGLACERYGTYLSEIGQADGLKKQLSEAVDHYNRWGAKRKVELLLRHLTSIEN